MTNWGLVNFMMNLGLVIWIVVLYLEIQDLKK